MRIEKKCYKKYFDAILAGDKTFEIRLADFKAKAGDILVLKEVDEDKNYTGRVIEKEISYLLKTKEMEEWFSKEDIEKYGFQIMAFKN